MSQGAHKACNVIRLLWQTLVARRFPQPHRSVCHVTDQHRWSANHLLPYSILRKDQAQVDKQPHGRLINGIYYDKCRQRAGVGWLVTVQTIAVDERGKYEIS